MRVTAKICGLTSAADAHAAVSAGADYLGFVFFPASRRCLGMPPPPWVRGVAGAPKVGVFRDQPEETLARVREEVGLDLLQLHGSETPATCAALGGAARVIKAIPVADAVDWGRVREYAAAARILFDTASPTGGGTGRAFDWRRLAGAPEGLEFWLAGGLTPDNVAAAIAAVRPAGVDVASGVEASPGRKDAEKMCRFIAAVRGVPTFEGSNVRRFNDHVKSPE